MFFRLLRLDATRLSSYGPSHTSATLIASITTPQCQRGPPGQEPAAVGDAEYAGGSPT